MSDLSAWGAIANGSRECAPDDKLRVLRRPACNKLAEYAALFRPAGYGLDVAWNTIAARVEQLMDSLGPNLALI